MSGQVNQPHIECELDMQLEFYYCKYLNMYWHPLIYQNTVIYHNVVNLFKVFKMDNC